MKEILLLRIIGISLLLSLSMFGQTKININTQTKGILPKTRGGTGTTTPNLTPGPNISINGVWPNQTIGVTGISTAFPYYDASSFPGTDWCAQVNAADTAALGINAIILVPSSMSSMPACNVSINLTANHILQFDHGTFDMGIQTNRAGIRIGAGVSNVITTGRGVGQSILYYTSVNTGAGNGFPNGAAIGIGRVTGCTDDAVASNYIIISGLSIRDRNIGGALGSGHSPSGIDGACVNFMIIENSEFTDIKGNAAITVTGNFGGGGGDTYINRNNIFNGTAVGGGGEFEGDNSSNWTHLTISNNTFSRWPCAIGISKANQGLIVHNIADMTLKAPYSGCVAIGIGAGSDTSGQLSSVYAEHNIITMGFSGVAMALFPNSTINSLSELGIIGNKIYQAAGSSITGISINGAGVGHTPPTMIVRGNVASVNYPTAVVGVLGNVEFSDNIFENSSVNVPLFNCAGSASIQPGKLVRLLNNRIAQASTTLSSTCTDPSFNTTQFQHRGNNIGTALPD